VPLGNYGEFGFGGMTRQGRVKPTYKCQRGNKRAKFHWIHGKEPLVPNESPTAVVTGDFDITIYHAGYYSLKPKFTVLNTTGVPISDASGILYTGTMNFSFTGVTGAAPISNVFHRPMADIEDASTLYNACAVPGIGLWVNNSTPVMSEGGRICAAEIPPGMDWTEYLSDGSNALFMTSNYGIAPYSMIQERIADNRYEGLLQTGVYGWRMPVRDVNFKQIQRWNRVVSVDAEQLATVVPIFSPLVPESPELIAAWVAPVPGGNVTSQLLTLKPCASMCFSSFNRFASLRTDYMSESEYELLFKLLDKVRNESMGQFSSNDGHIKNIGRDVRDALRTTRMLNREVRQTVREVAPGMLKWIDLFLG